MKDVFLTLLFQRAKKGRYWSCMIVTEMHNFARPLFFYICFNEEQNVIFSFQNK